MRPLLMFLDILEIRYLGMIAFGILLLFVLHLIQKTLGLACAASYLISLLLSGVWIVPLSLQFAPVFYIANISIIIVLLLKMERLKKYAIFLFFVIGSVTNFVDFLTAPLATLGLPLIIATLRLQKGVPFILKNSASWGAGYGLTWLAKWVLATVFTSENTLLDAYQSILLRTRGVGEAPVRILRPLARNLTAMFPSFVLVIAALAFVVLIVLFFVRGKKVKDVLQQAPLLAIAMYPYVWYELAGNHSFVHYWFTYRSQAIAVFALLVFMFHAIKKQAHE